MSTPTPTEEGPPAAGSGEGAQAPAPAEGELARLKAERDDLRDRWLRAQADYQNLRRRTQTDVDNAVRRGMQSLLANMLLVIDHLDYALSAPCQGEDARRLAQGVRQTRDHLLAALRQEGVEQVQESESFDPSLHQAVSTVERADLAPGSIVDTLRAGYTWRGAVLRPAHVRVARAPGAAAAEEPPPLAQSASEGETEE